MALGGGAKPYHLQQQKQKQFVTGTSHVISHRSTSPADRRLTAAIERERVLATAYERIMIETDFGEPSTWGVV